MLTFADIQYICFGTADIYGVFSSELTWRIFPVPHTDCLAGGRPAHRHQPLVVAAELETLHAVAPVRGRQPQHRPLGDHRPVDS